MNPFKKLQGRVVLWIWNHSPNCAEMSRLASRSLDEPHPWGLRLRMRLHHLICEWCRRYATQLQTLHRLAPRLCAEETFRPGVRLPPEARGRILRWLRERV